MSKPSVMVWYPHLRPGGPISRHASGLLLPGDAQGFAVQLFGVLRMPLRQQQLALAPVQLRCEPALPCSLRQLQGIVQQAQALLDLTQDFTWSRAKGGMAKLWELRAATSLARLWGEQGRRGEACDLLAPVYGSWAELKNGNVAEGRSFRVCQPKLCSALGFPRFLTAAREAASRSPGWCRGYYQQFTANTRGDLGLTATRCSTVSPHALGKVCQMGRRMHTIFCYQLNKLTDLSNDLPARPVALQFALTLVQYVCFRRVS